MSWSSSSFHLIYSQTQMMPCRCNYHYSFLLSSSHVHNWKPIENIWIYFFFLLFFSLSLSLLSFIVDYLTITISITTNAPSTHQLEIYRKTREKRKPREGEMSKKKHKYKKKESFFSQVFIFNVTLWHVDAYVRVHPAEQTETYQIP